MGLRTWAWPSFAGLHMGTKTSAGPSVARLGLNNSLLITGRPQPEPQPEEEKNTGAIPVSLGSAGGSRLSLPRRPGRAGGRLWCTFASSARLRQGTELTSSSLVLICKMGSQLIKANGR